VEAAAKWLARTCFHMTLSGGEGRAQFFTRGLWLVQGAIGLEKNYSRIKTSEAIAEKGGGSLKGKKARNRIGKMGREGVNGF